MTLHVMPDDAHEQQSAGTLAKPWQTCPANIKIVGANDQTILCHRRSRAIQRVKVIVKWKKKRHS